MTTVKVVTTEAAKRLQKAIVDIEKTSAKVGWFKSAVYPDGTPVAQVATINEYGAPARNIPPRPFMRPTITQRETEWETLAANESRKVMAGAQTVNGMFTVISLKAAAQVKITIKNIHSPALAESTVRARLARRKNKTITATLRKPLVDTGYMLSTLSSAVFEGVTE